MTTDSDWTEAHGDAVAEVAPDSPAPTDSELDRGWAEISARISTSTTPRRSRRLVVAGTATAVVLGVAGTAAAAVWTGHTGHTGQGPVDKEDLRLGGPGERIDLSGDDLRQIIEEVTEDIPFPSEEARVVSNSTQTAELETDAPDESASTGAIRGFTADDAICSWANAWAAAVASGDDAAKAAAADVLMDADTWPAVTDLDTKLEIRRKPVTIVIDGERHRTIEKNDTRFAYLTLVQDAADDDDIAAMGASLAPNVRCIPGLVPQLPEAIPGGMRH